MQPSSPPEFMPPPSTSTLPPRPGGGGGGKTGVILGAIAVAIALVAVGVALVAPHASSSSPSTSVTLWAVVASTGTLARGSGVANASINGTGIYNVTFNRSIAGCSLAANLGTTDAGNAVPGAAVPALYAGSISEVQVHTSDVAGTATDETFHLAATCSGGQPGLEFTAVVNATGSLVSGSGATKVQHSGTGIFQVIFVQNVRNCSYILGLGESTSGTPPAGSIGGAQYGANQDGVWVNEYTASGASTDGAFHLAVYC